MVTLIFDDIFLSISLSSSYFLEVSERAFLSEMRITLYAQVVQWRRSFFSLAKVTLLPPSRAILELASLHLFLSFSSMGRGGSAKMRSDFLYTVLPPWERLFISVIPLISRSERYSVGYRESSVDLFPPFWSIFSPRSIFTRKLARVRISRSSAHVLSLDSLNHSLEGMNGVGHSREPYMFTSHAL